MLDAWILEMKHEKQYILIDSANTTMLTSRNHQSGGGFGRTVSISLAFTQAEARQMDCCLARAQPRLLTLDFLQSLAYAYCCQVDHRSKQIEDVIQLQRRLNAQMEQLDAEAHREIEASIRHETAVNKLMAQSEPTTPPEYQDAFPCMSSQFRKHYNIGC